MTHKNQIFFSIVRKTFAFVPPIPEELRHEEILQALEKLPQAFRDVIVLTDDKISD